MGNLCADQTASPWAPGLHARAFTLLEVVVVIAVSIVLATAVVPTLIRVRDRTQRTICGANLRSLGMATVVYAVNNNRALPTHLSRSTASFDTFAMREGSGKDVNLGLLVDYVPSAPVFYCPTQSEENSPSIAYDGTHNRWRFRYRKGILPDGANTGGESGPVGGEGLGDEGDTGDGEQSVAVNSSYPARARFRPVLGLPRWTLANYSNKVIYSDFIGVDGWSGTGPLAGSIRAPHGGDGYNRLFGDDSVQWVDAEAVNASRPIGVVAPTEDELQEYYLLLDVLP
jgi:type II secretory pathway pseudopilin PulG